MPLLNIELAIKRPDVSSRFKLVNIASQRARELNSGNENVVALQTNNFEKITTNILEEIIDDKVSFNLTNPK